MPDIKEQLEFYFSDANMSKNRFIIDKMEENNGWLPVEILLTFNKLKSMECTPSHIRNAVLLSNLLELNPEGTCIRRIIPFQRINSDDRTIYIEPLPCNVTHEDLHEYFKPLKVAFAAVPKQESGKVRGYGFIEFNDPDTMEQGISLWKENRDNEGHKLHIWSQRNKEYKELLHLMKEIKKCDRNNKHESKLGWSQPKGTICQVLDITPNIVYSDLKQFIQKYGQVAFLDYFNGRPFAFVRFKNVQEMLNATDKINKLEEKPFRKLAKLHPLEEYQYRKNVTPREKRDEPQSLKSISKEENEHLVFESEDEMAFEQVEGTLKRKPASYNKVSKFMKKEK
ncbi:hypothetical protein O9G_000908 [Rozella allomycis CSF55]|uniref:Uncharacterized protein n=1 Tax=Rozella allomycis (strain CSF55) TaxID=988480 RepID=A0A075ARV2_ROZAC|nr:hypothetical protein O9G_000908 [Rozella allomycis CSF55]|eukprot:EPZ31263.1 hypothetical protein O9G_000908 [Rozella allomycis CSF55]